MKRTTKNALKLSLRGTSKGICSLSKIAGSKIRVHRTGFESDMARINNDWIRTGDYIRTAYAKINKQ